jgi:hypothetical protein
MFPYKNIVSSGFSTLSDKGQSSLSAARGVAERFGGFDHVANADRMSRRVLCRSGSQDFVAEVTAEILRGAQVHAPPV